MDGPIDSLEQKQTKVAEKKKEAGFAGHFPFVFSVAFCLIPAAMGSV